MNSKRIAIISTVESHVIKFHIPFIEMFIKMGFSVDVLTNFNKEKKLLMQKGVNCINIPFSRKIFSFRNIKSLIKLRYIFKEKEYNLIHTHTPISSFISRWAANKFKKTKVFYTTHGFYFRKKSNKFMYKIFYFIEKAMVKYTDKIITMNKEDYNFAIKMTKNTKCEVNFVHGVGIDFSKYNKITDDLVINQVKNKFDISKNDFILLCISEFIKRKNIVQAIKSMNNTPENCKLIILGDGKLKNNLKAITKRYSLEKKIIFLGHRKNVNEILSITNVLILTSLLEGLPRSIMEAMAIGLPIIATNTKGNIDLVENKKNGFIVEIGDYIETNKKILELYNNRELVKLMGYESKKRIKKYDIKFVLDEMKYIYQNFNLGGKND